MKSTSKIKVLYVQTIPRKTRFCSTNHVHFSGFTKEQIIVYLFVAPLNNEARLPKLSSSSSDSVSNGSQKCTAFSRISETSSDFLIQILIIRFYSSQRIDFNAVGMKLKITFVQIVSVVVFCLFSAFKINAKRTNRCSCFFESPKGLVS